MSGFIVFPFIWAIPEALVTAELGAAFQDPSAGLAWVEHAFGERMGGLNGYFGWLSGALGTHFLLYFLFNIRSPAVGVLDTNIIVRWLMTSFHSHTQIMQSTLLYSSNIFLV